MSVFPRSKAKPVESTVSAEPIGLNRARPENRAEDLASVRVAIHNIEHPRGGYAIIPGYAKPAGIGGEGYWLPVPPTPPATGVRRDGALEPPKAKEDEAFRAQLAAVAKRQGELEDEARKVSYVMPAMERWCADLDTTAERFGLADEVLMTHDRVDLETYLRDCDRFHRVCKVLVERLRVDP